MKKIACLSALAAVLAFTAGTSVAATSTVTGGYAQSDAQCQMNKMGGFNLKYRYEEDNSPLGVIGSFTYTEKSRTASSGDYNKNQYYVNATNTALLVREVQSNVFHRVELQTRTVGETVVAGVVFVGRVFSGLEFTITHTHYTVDACPVVNAVSRTTE